MNLRINEFEREYELSNGKVNFLIVESPGLFDQLLIMISQQLSGYADTITIYDIDKRQDSKIIDIITSPLDISLSANNLKKKLLAFIEGDIETTHLFESMSEIYKKISDVLDVLSCSIDFDISYDMPASITDILDVCNVQLEKPSGSFAERLTKYIKTVHRLLGKKLFIIYNCANYISSADLDKIDNMVEYEGATLLMIDAYQDWNSFKGKCYILDNNMCDIY